MHSPYDIGESPDSADALAQVISLLRPRAVFSRHISAAGPWAVRYSAFGAPSFCAILDGRCRLAVDGLDALLLEAGDFVLLPATPAFTMSGLDQATPVLLDPAVMAGVRGAIRHGRQEAPADVRMLGGWFAFDSPDSEWLVSLLPTQIHVRGVERLSTLVRLVDDETSQRRAGRDLILARLVDVLLIEALRQNPERQAPPGLLRGLADPRLAPAIRQLHGDVARPWTAAALSRAAGLSRSAFFERFTRTVGARPMEYLLAWRMALAKDLLRRRELGLDEIAERVGYGSASTFSTAFSRHVGVAPSRFASA